MAIYELVLMGDPSAEQVPELEGHLSRILEPLGLRLGHEVTWSINPTDYGHQPQVPTAVAFFGKAGVSPAGIRQALQRGIPVLPVISTEGRVGQELPDLLRPINCMSYADDGALRVATALLECIGLLPRQRRVFVSYRRDSARQAALQLFNQLSARLYDVFLDTHGIAPGDDFQAVLWHRLCDSDVLIILDTQNYFESRWTAAEFGRALAKNISVLRIGWPGVHPSPRVSTASRVDLVAQDVDATTGRLTDETLARIGLHVEMVRAQGHAVRHVNLFSKIQQAIETIGGAVIGVGAHRAVYATLPDGTDIVAFPEVGVPTSVTLHNAIERGAGRSVAIVFDHVGLHAQWVQHLAWLGEQVRAARWVRVSEAAWTFAGWGVE